MLGPYDGLYNIHYTIVMEKTIFHQGAKLVIGSCVKLFLFPLKGKISEE